MCVCVCVQAITDDDVDRMAMCIRVLAEQSPKMFDIFTHLCRESLSVMLTAKADEEKQFNKVSPPTKSSSTRSASCGKWLCCVVCALLAYMTSLPLCFHQHTSLCTRACASRVNV